MVHDAFGNEFFRTLALLTPCHFCFRYATMIKWNLIEVTLQDVCNEIDVESTGIYYFVVAQFFALRSVGEHMVMVNTRGCYCCLCPA